MKQQLDRQALARVLQAENIETLSASRILELFRAEKGLADFLPDGVCQTDPRNGDRILFNSSRARRPHDNPPPSAPPAPQECAVCQGRTTGVIDVSDLSQGFTFINKNLYPSLYPLEGNRVAPALKSCGLHFLQWTSSLHDKDWHNMPLADCAVVMGRLAALEKKLLTEFAPSPEPVEEQHGFVLLIKNYGRLVGGSLAHGHQQIGFSNVMPRRVRDNWRFAEERGETFSTYLMRENPPGLLIRDYGAALLLTPYFMRRPFDMLLLLKDASHKHLYQLTEAEIAAVAEGWHDAIRAMRLVMPEIGRDIAYNVITYNGPGAGLYFEFLPYTQETGGFEHLGLLVCQANPQSAAARIRQHLKEDSN